ncbi:hypothetical protein PVAP13_4KG154405 [Panicum virgatum]|uniref:Uncharacterized protein n=1 Tax=Panicum virgatum TaxID=38727 RepID=A0A8T0TJ63_PANVG|nr:hypothetical protein PVAP13_4KG154405 [Panicum virgatum]
MKIGWPILLNQQSSPPNTVHQMAQTFMATTTHMIPTASLQSGNIKADQEETESHPSLTSNVFPA